MHFSSASAGRVDIAGDTWGLEPEMFLFLREVQILYWEHVQGDFLLMPRNEGIGGSVHSDD